MNEEELFELIRKNYNEANQDYLREQIKAAMKHPPMSREDTLNGLLDWVLIAGCTGMNDLYRNYVFSAIGYLIETAETERES